MPGEAFNGIFLFFGIAGDVKFYEVLSLDLLRNSVSALVDLGVVIAAKR